MRLSGRSEAFRLGVALAAVAVVTLVFSRWLHVANAATVSIAYLMVVLLVAATSRLRVAVATSIASMLCLNFFFLPPVGKFTIHDTQNWVALFAFLTVSLVASHLSAVAQARTHEAVGRRDELARLFDLSRDVLMMTDDREALAVLARAVALRFDLDFVAIALPRGTTWEIHDAGTQNIPLDVREFSNAFASAQTTLGVRCLRAHLRGPSHCPRRRVVFAAGPLAGGTKPIGMLAAAGRPVEAGTLDALAGSWRLRSSARTSLKNGRPAS